MLELRDYQERSLAARFRGHLPPFTPEALDAWIADVMGRMDLSELMEPA